MLLSQKRNIDLLNIVMIGITNELPEKDERYELHRLICALLSNQVQGNKKFDILEKEDNITTDQYRVKRGCECYV